MTLDRRARRAAHGIEEAVEQMQAERAKQDEAGSGPLGRFEAYRRRRSPARRVAAGAAFLLAGLGIVGGVALLRGLGETVPVERPADLPAEQACLDDRLIGGSRLPSEKVQRILPRLSNTPREMAFGRCYRLAADRGTVARGHQLILGELGLGGRFVSGLRHVLVHPSGYTAGMMEAGVLVFSDEGAAREAHRLLLPGILGPAEELDEPLEPVRQVPAEGLGEESFGLRGSILVPGVDGVLFAWQRSDLLLWALGAREMGRPGTAPVDEMLEVARSMDARAE